MTLAFIIVAVLAIIFFFLWERDSDKLIEADGMITRLRNRIDELENDPSKAVSVKQTPLAPEFLDDVIRNNGFSPNEIDADWVGFKWEGEKYCISRNNLPVIQFYRGFSYGNDANINLLKKAAAIAMEEIWYGHVAFSEEEKIISFRVFAVEKSVEHFTDSFMDYMNMLDHLVECHRYFYQKLEEDQKTITLGQTQIEAPYKETKVLS